jgi:hypothetical protein
LYFTTWFQISPLRFPISRQIKEEAIVTKEAPTKSSSKDVSNIVDPSAAVNDAVPAPVAAPVVQVKEDEPIDSDDEF